MADVCGECETWLTREPRHETIRGDARIEIRRCHACSGNAANPWPVWTPADATCPAFKRRADAAERAARRAWDQEPLGNDDGRRWIAAVAAKFREEQAKDKEAR